MNKFFFYLGIYFFVFVVPLITMPMQQNAQQPEGSVSLDSMPIVDESVDLDVPIPPTSEDSEVGPIPTLIDQSIPTEPAPAIPISEDLSPIKKVTSTMQVGLPVSQRDLEIDKQKQELEQLKVQLDDIEQQEETLMAKLREVQSQMNQAQGQVASARQTKQQILGAQTVEQAQGLLDQLNMIFNQIQTIQTQLQGQFLQEFDNVVTQIQNQIQLVQAKANEIKNKSAVVMSPPPMQSLPIQPEIVKKKIELKSPLAKKVANIIALIIGFFLDLIKWFSDLVSRPEEVSVEKISPAETIAQPSKASMPPTVALPPQTVPLTQDDLSKKFNDQMQAYEKTIQRLKQRKEKIKKEEMQIEEKKKLLSELKQQKTALKKYKGLMKQLGFSVETAKTKKNKFRKSIEFIFSQALDFSEVILEKVGTVSIAIYDRILLPRLQNFVKAVQERVEQDNVDDEPDEKGFL